MLRFSNSGEIDPRLIMTLGVNVKDNASPIGYFGTGLKYAIAGVLRIGGRVEIHSGLMKYHFVAHAETIRGKDFNFIRMNDLLLGFTTDLGKNWEPWMWYRELASNTYDEGGEVSQVTEVGEPQAGTTNIYVTWLDTEHTKRDQIFLTGKPFFVREGVAEVYEGRRDAPNAIYYRGVKIVVPEKPARFRYNVTSKLDLTEDRTLRSMWDARCKISLTALFIEDERVLTELLTAPQDTFESMLDWDWSMDAPVCDRVIQRLMQTRIAEVNPSAIRRMKARTAAAKPPVAFMSNRERMMLVSATEFLRDRLSINITVPVHATEALGKGVHGIAWGGEIYLSRLAFEQGTDWLSVTLIEEWCHAERGLSDYSRELQTWLLNKIVSAARSAESESKGAP
jgi:hypothetical protein